MHMHIATHPRQFFRHAPVQGTGAKQRCNALAHGSGARRRSVAELMPSSAAQGQMPSGAAGAMPSWRTRHVALGTTARVHGAYAAGKETDKHGGVFG